MLKHSASRNLRPSGRRYNIKNVSQICLVLAVSLWMLYQLRHCYFFKEASTDEGTGHDKAVATLGRKGLLPGQVEEGVLTEDAKDTDETGRGDEFEQVDDLMEEADDQEAEIDDDKDQDAESLPRGRRLT